MCILVDAPLIRKANLNDLPLLLVRLRLRQDDWCADETPRPVNAIQNTLVRPDLNHSLASRRLDGKMEFRAVRTKIEDEVRRQRGFHIEVEHRKPRSRVHIQPPREQVADEILEESPRCLLIAVLRKVNETKETRRDRVNNSGNSFGLHSRSLFRGDGIAESFPLCWLRDEELFVDCPREFLALLECKIFLVLNERCQRLRARLGEELTRSPVNAADELLVRLALDVFGECVLQLLVEF